MSNAPAVVLFDLDGMLVHYDHAARLQLLAERSGAGVEAVSQALFGSGLERDADLGLHDAQGQAGELARRLGRPVSLDDCIAARRAATRAHLAVLALAQRIARHAQVAILTNNNLLLRDHLPTICPPLFPLFDGSVFCSAQFRLAKPDPAIFVRCLAALGHAPAEALFIDDKRENAEGARRAGLRAHHYRNLPALLTALRELDFPED
ncbi:HAD-IA family hydrolase [Luteimonas mephitis]|uniref:HAD-IA family hydrolase n=1 Tax=Luteimonas mephitis TaxID=83615 RepID=UPI003A932140